MGNQPNPPIHPNEPDRRGDPAKDERKSRRDDVPPQMDAKRRDYLAKQYGMHPDQITVIRNSICPTASDTELEFFLATCKRTQLDPFTRQIYFIKRRQRIEDRFGNVEWIEVGRPEVSIDGLRTSAERTGDYEGQAAMQWCGGDGRWIDVWIASEAPAAALATIFRKGHREPMRSVAVFNEYCPKFPSKTGPDRVPHMWSKMPSNQIGKCAEALGFRKSFPQTLSGLYITEEMEHTDQPIQAASAPPQAHAPARGTPTAPEVLPKSEQQQLPPPAKRTAIEDALDTIARATLARDLERVALSVENAKKNDTAAAKKFVDTVGSALDAKRATL